ncbi:flagellar hook-length control protein FliK, partial [Sulfurimonas sp.]|uniref:flagellar hook-length control protein FliK n=1 Tax=Sulfurimonas sp. TaxID=2022749 RepID=UPI002620B4C7
RDKSSQNSTTAMPLTADFSVATAKVIAPSVNRASTKNLEALLKTSKSKSEEKDTKTEVMHAPKADSFEVKLHEAKQMVKYLSHDIKTAIEDYKSPFTRVKVQLNPQKLGEVDLTIVQRGKNLHINLSSNNAAINTLAMNANDLKVQLNNSGINNASLNFSNNSQDSGQSSFGQQQQNSQHGREARDEYNYIEHEEKNEEILNSLEIVVPNYA